MRAWVYRTPGKVDDVLHLERAWPVPAVGPGEVLVQVHTVALNPGGAKLMQTFPYTWAIRKPAVPESDFSGTVVIADGGGLFAVGDRVCGTNFASMFKGQGALAEYVPVLASQLVRVPDGVSMTDAGSLPGAGPTSYHVLSTQAKIPPGARVFVNGGTSGTGLMAVQILRHRGAYVVATGNPASLDLLTALGADEVIDYRAVGDLPAYLGAKYGDEPFDYVYDTVGAHALFYGSPAYLTPAGVYLDIAGAYDQKTFVEFLRAVGAILGKLVWPRVLGGAPRRFAFSFAPDGGKQAALQAVIDLVARGEIKIVLDSEHAFEDVKAGFRIADSGRAKGKIVVRVA